MSHGDRDRDLQAMRTRYWVKVIKQIAKQEGKEDKAFIRELETNPLYADVADWEWWDYLSGDQVPQSKRLNIVEKLLPGTAESFTTGPRGLELWEVLAGPKLAERTFNAALVASYGSKAVNGWDLAEKAFWFILPMLSFKVGPFVAQMNKKMIIVDGKERPVIREGEHLPWSDIQRLIERGSIVLDEEKELIRAQSGEVLELKLSELLALCDDTRKLYTLENTLADLGSEIVEYAYNLNERDYSFGFTAEFILPAFSLWWIAQENNNNRVKNIARLIIQAMNNEVIELEFEEVGADLKDFVARKLI
ncbi:hypothetical protein F7R25_04225 [Burkholderia stagnalis]|uniref:Uncharacterized protein n=1 Tax=Burkholderia stagnalis TaxID=1503054 RepID=A0A6L3N582_9BURK|nr:hypothetical protein [Burkholderia stagnalis]KAB0640712.1 hypothetical protein F7R25_04225 [Burkholderia stagnalis]VWB06937.1 hypothetical protein BST28156_00149 [Burkholderia stagnalis]